MGADRLRSGKRKRAQDPPQRIVLATELLADDEGTSVVEFALIAPVLVLLLLGTVDIGTAIYDKFALNAAVSAAEQYAILNASSVSSTAGPAACAVAGEYRQQCQFRRLGQRRRHCQQRTDRNRDRRRPDDRGNGERSRPLLLPDSGGERRGEQLGVERDLRLDLLGQRDRGKVRDDRGVQAIHLHLRREQPDPVPNLHDDDRGAGSMIRARDERMGRKRRGGARDPIVRQRRRGDRVRPGRDAVSHLDVRGHRVRAVYVDDRGDPGDGDGGGAMHRHEPEQLFAQWNLQPVERRLVHPERGAEVAADGARGEHHDIDLGLVQRRHGIFESAGHLHVPVRRSCADRPFCDRKGHHGRRLASPGPIDNAKPGRFELGTSGQVQAIHEPRGCGSLSHNVTRCDHRGTPAGLALAVRTVSCVSSDERRPGSETDRGPEARGSARGRRPRQCSRPDDDAAARERSPGQPCALGRGLGPFCADGHGTAADRRRQSNAWHGSVLQKARRGGGGPPQRKSADADRNE